MARIDRGSWAALTAHPMREIAINKFFVLAGCDCRDAFKDWGYTVECNTDWQSDITGATMFTFTASRDGAVYQGEQRIRARVFLHGDNDFEIRMMMPDGPSTGRTYQGADGGPAYDETRKAAANDMIRAIDDEIRALAK